MISAMRARPRASLSLVLALGLSPCTREEPPAPASSPPASAPRGPISGLVKLASEPAGLGAAPSDVLFIMARESLGKGRAGRLVAVKRIAGPEFPLRYTLGPADLMFPEKPFAGPMIVHARLDRDGDPRTRSGEDLYAAAEEPVSPGQEGVHLLLAPPRPGEDGPPAQGEGTAAPSPSGTSPSP